MFQLYKVRQPFKVLVVVTYLCSANTKDIVKVNTLKKKKNSTSIPEVRFNLKSLTDENKPTLIRAVFRYNSKRLVYSTKEEIAQNNWNSKKESPKSAFYLYADIK